VSQYIDLVKSSLPSPLSPAGKFVNAVHEIGHIVNLRHNPDPISVMYPVIENSSKLRELANAEQYRISHILNLRHILKTKPVLCRYIQSVSRARLDKHDLATLSRSHLMRDGTVPPGEERASAARVFSRDKNSSCKFGDQTEVPLCVIPGQREIRGVQTRGLRETGQMYPPKPRSQSHSLIPNAAG
jgi:hypothetical protein